MDDEMQASLDRMRASPYVASVKPLEPVVRGLTVHSSSATSAGFMLRFDDDSWVICFLEDGCLRWKRGHGDPLRRDLDLMGEPDEAWTSPPLEANLPYADESCDLEAELSKAHGQPVVGLAYGERCFNFCFPAGRELETMVVAGQSGLRVFWEQW